MIDQRTIERVAAAIDSVDASHSMRLIRLVDGVSTYRLEMDGAVEEFTDTDEDDAIDLCYARIRQVKQRKQAEAVIAALIPQSQSGVMVEIEANASEAVEALFADLRDRRFLKWLFDRDGDANLIGRFDSGEELRGLDLEVQAEIRNDWHAIIAKAFAVATVGTPALSMRSSVE